MSALTEILHHWLEIMTDPAHLLAEVSLMFLVDVVFMLGLWPMVLRAIKREHRVIDIEHGIPHDIDLTKVSDADLHRLLEQALEMNACLTQALAARGRKKVRR